MCFGGRLLNDTSGISRLSSKNGNRFLLQQRWRRIKKVKQNINYWYELPHGGRRMSAMLLVKERESGSLPQNRPRFTNFPIHRIILAVDWRCPFLYLLLELRLEDHRLSFCLTIYLNLLLANYCLMMQYLLWIPLLTRMSQLLPLHITMVLKFHQPPIQVSPMPLPQIDRYQNLHRSGLELTLTAQEYLRQSLSTLLM